MKRIPALIITVTLIMFINSCKSVSHKTNHSPDIQGNEIKATNLSGLNKKIVEEAMTWLGTPYEYAKSDKGRGTDCSGMVMMVYAEAANCKIPRNSAKQADYCNTISAKDVKAGDLVFFATGKNPDIVSHVGIMIDNDRFIHAATKSGVTITFVSNPYYSNRLIMYGRIPGIKL